MRTTVTLDSDVERALRDRMEREGISFKSALNEAIRDGIGERAPRFETPAFDLGAASANVTKANALAADLEDDDIVRKLAA